MSGNAYFGNLEKNNVVYFDVVEGWISRIANSLGAHD